MSEDIYENAVSFHNTNPEGNTDENTCMIEVTKGSQQWTPDSSGGQERRYKLAVVLVCVLLLAVTIALCITSLKTRDLQLRCKNLVEDKDQLQLQYNNITSEKAQLQLQYKNLVEEKDELQLQYNNIAAEKAQLETKFSAERDELQRRLDELESHDMKNITQHAVDVTLDPDTANPHLILSADGKQVKIGAWKNLPDTPKRFSHAASVLGREGFSSGKFYYEVQVTGKTKWDIGVAKESIDRKGDIYLWPTNGYWTVGLIDGTYKAQADLAAVPLSLNGTIQRVGVFVDYDAGLVSFHDANCWNHIYSFTNVSFTEKIYPFFSPDNNEGGRNSAPLIINPVDACPIK